MFKSLKLGTKFTLLLLVVFIAGTGISYAALSQALLRRAEDDVTTKGLVLIQLMNSVRNYTTLNIQPLLAPLLNTQPQFIKEYVPAFSARTVFSNLRQNSDYADFFYKEATLNPTNPGDQADDFEATLVQRFRSDPQTKEIGGYRVLNGENVFYSARPLSITKPACLGCHTDPATAPKRMVATYGTNGGFHWSLNEIVSAQVVYVPAESVFNDARLSLALVMAIFVGIFAVAVIVINIMLRRSVVQPIGLMAALANKISNNEISAGGFELAELEDVAKRSDELGKSAQVFRRMAQEVYNREQSLSAQVTQLRIEIDVVKKAKQVSEITDTDYFQTLQAKAIELRRKTADLNQVPPSPPLPSEPSQ